MKTAKQAFTAVVLLSSAASAQQYVISTYAGGGISPVKSIPALQASLGGPTAEITADAQGNTYFANLNAVFKLDTNGTIRRIAGSGVGGFSGDGGPATMASLQISLPGQLFAQGLAVDGAGNLWIGDIGNHRVRKVSPDGIITTVAGNGVSGSSGDGGPAVEAQLGQPSGLAVDRTGNLFIADLNSNVVREVSVSGIITTVAGVASLEPAFSGDGGPATSARLALPWTIALDLNGNLFIADALNHRIRRVSTDGTITTVAGNDARAVNGTGPNSSGPATSIALDFPSGLAVDDQGNLFIADASFEVIRKVTPSGMLSPVVGNGSFGFSGDGGPAIKAQLNAPWGVALDGRNNLFIADFGNQRIREVLANGTINTVAGGGAIDLLAVAVGTAVATDAQLKVAVYGLGVQSGMATDVNGNVFFAETGSGLVRKISPDGSMTTVAGGGSCSGQNTCPLGDGGPATSAYLQYPTGVAVDGKGNLFIADYGNIRVRRVTPDGIITTVAGNGALGFSGDGGQATAAQINAQAIAVDAAGNLFIATSGPVRKVSPDGIITTVAGGSTCAGPSCDGGPAINAYVGANAVAVDALGNLLIADNSVDDFGCYFYIRKVSPSGIISTLAGVAGPCEAAGDGGPAASAALSFSSSISADGAGKVFLTDYNGERIRRISPDGIITTVAGGQFGYSGDGGPAVDAAVNYPIAVAADGGGNVYFSDAFNEVIRVLRPITHPALSALVDAASQGPDPVTPGKIVVIYGTGLGPASLAQNQPGTLPGGVGFGSAVGGTTVTFNSVSAPVLYASATQVGVVVPYAISGTSAQVRVTYLGDVSDAFTVQAAAAAPSFFTLNQSGTGQEAAINASSGKSNTAANPVKIGEYITLYATGEGQTIPAGQDGRLVDSTSIHPVLPVAVTIGGIPALVQYAGGASGQVAGLMQINVQIPNGVQPGGYVPVVLQVGTATSRPDAVWIAVSGQ
jgi:uncharacterized protein (TIGR03437 family)